MLRINLTYHKKVVCMNDVHRLFVYYNLYLLHMMCCIAGTLLYCITSCMYRMVCRHWCSTGYELVYTYYVFRYLLLSYYLYVVHYVTGKVRLHTIYIYNVPVCVHIIHGVCTISYNVFPIRILYVPTHNIVILYVISLHTYHVYAVRTVEVYIFRF
jgi:hypothetical protein